MKGYGLVAYLDESASQNPKDVFAVGGYLGYANRWRKLRRRWPAVLMRYGVDPPVFHMTDFENRKGPFAPERLAEDGRVPMLLELFELIRSYALVGVTNAFPATEYELLCEKYMPRQLYRPPFSEIAAEIRDPTNNCLLTCMERIELFRARHRIRGKVKIVFDHNHAAAPRIARFYRIMVDSLRLASFEPDIGFASRDEAIPLQAADVVAYEAMKHVRNCMVGKVRRPMRKSAKVLARAHGSLVATTTRASWIFAESARRTLAARSITP